MNLLKITVLSSILFSVANLAYAEDLNTKCFKYASSLEVSSSETVKLKIPNTATDIFFVQGREFVPYKIFEAFKGSDLNFSVISATSGDKTNYKFITDGNPATVYRFDDLTDKSKSVTLDFGRKIEKGNFFPRFDFIHEGIVKFSISEDNSSYSPISEYALRDFSFRYLKIDFINFRDDANVRKTQINDIIVEKTSPMTYLIKPYESGKISVYSNYECSPDLLGEMYTKYLAKSMKSTFPIDSGTKTVDVKMLANGQYDNDFDKDGLLNDADNCKYKSNADQKDADGDLVGDVCDFDNSSKNPLDYDSDKDGAGDSVDNCKYDFNPNQKDSDSNGAGDICTDDDADGIIGKWDNCPLLSNPDQKDVNINNIGDACEFDKDKDGVFDSVDNCVTNPNPDQSDKDNDGIGDACDNCKLYNPDQTDKDKNGNGDVCDNQQAFEKTHDKDKDGKVDSIDNCKDIANAGQEDLDKDLIGDACDNCLSIQNPKQEDEDKNSVGDMCEDSDKDSIEGFKDNCMTVANADQKDSDNDSIGDVCEDHDSDNIIFAKDNCPYDYNPDQSDVDKDKKGDVCDKKDDRFVESNRVFFIALLGLISVIFGVGIVSMVKKMNKK